MRTCPSIEEDPTYMRFEGVRETGCCLGVLAEGDIFELFGVEGLGEARFSDATLFAASNFVAARGGGNGDMERAEVDAV